jgi:two-component system, NtrC family, sensor kinase
VTELKRQLIGAFIVILTVVAVVAAAVNFQQQNKFELPEDGVTWVDRSTPLHPQAVVALHVAPGSAGDKFGIHEGDVLRRIGTLPVEKSTDVAQILVGSGAWKKLDYFVERVVTRQGVSVALETKLAVVVEARTAGSAVLYQYIVGAAYLFIGLFVFFRRGSAHRAVHFYLLCLASFVLNTFHYTGKLNNFDKVVYYSNVIAGLFLPTLFFHFAVAFPEPARPFRARWSRVLLYLPATALSMTWVLITSGTLRLDISLIELRWMMDRVWLLFVVSGQMAGAAVLALRYPRAEDPIVRQQLKWLRNGAVLGVLPFTLLYALPYALGAAPTPRMELAVLALVLVPVTWAYAIFRYRLMDVDVIFQQGYVYTLATLAVLAVFYGLLVSITTGRTSGVEGSEHSSRFDDLSPAALVVLILVAAFVFQPIRNWLQEVLDRYVTYYIPCTVRGRVIAWLGVSRTEDGDFLSTVTWNCSRRWPGTWPSPSRTPRSTARCSARCRSTSA